MEYILEQLKKLSLTIIGGGRVGQSLGKLLVQSGLVDLKFIVDLNLTAANCAVEFIGEGVALDSFSLLEPTALYFIAVEDAQIHPVAEKLSSKFDLSGSTIFHASGALSSEILKVTNANVASIHPIRSFASPEQSVLDFKGTYCGVEGDKSALALLTPLFTAIGGQCITIDSTQKTIYHAGAVIASNFLPLLIESSIQCYLKAGLTREVAMALVEPLAKDTLANIFKVGVKPAMTGPVVRGDFEVIDAHKKQLSHFLPDEAKLYSYLTEELLKLAKND